MKNIYFLKLIEAIPALVQAQFDAEMRFRMSAAKGSPQAGLAILAQLDQHFQKNA
ncbi:MAG: hypothetical protein QM752_04690 [Gammaproteobacteria bacterium]